jgi:methylated-DNA-[protein]-cysteine S-methyltransferase
MALFARRIGTPLGGMVLAVDEAGALVALEFCGARSAREVVAAVSERGEPVEWSEERGGDVVAQLEEYFRGERRAFELAMAPRGTAFQQRVWRELSRIPYGTTISYGELARRVGKASATAARAVGQANATNAIAVVIPCHRVIGADGTLTGYAAGLSFKAKLLALEGALAPDALLRPGPPRVRESARPAGRRPSGRASSRGADEQAELFTQS